MWANYVEMAAPPDLTLHRYDMAVSPEVVGRKLKQIIRLLLDSPELAPFRQDVVSDFRSTLLSRKKLAGKEIRVKIMYRNEEHDEPRDDAPTYTVRLLLTNSLTVGDLVDHLKSTTPSAGYVDQQPTIQALNILLNHHSRVSPDLVAVGSNRTFSLADGTPNYDLGAGLSAVRGFFASVRAATARILVNVNVSHGVFYKAGPLDVLMKEYSDRSRSVGSLNSFVSRVRVSMRHFPQKKRKNGEVVVKVKTVLGLATPSDGREQEHPPRVGGYGAGPKNVEFWLNPPASAEKTKASGGGGGKKKGAGKPSMLAAGGYITVFDYFQKSEMPHPVPLHDCKLTSASVKPTTRPWTSRTPSSTSAPARTRPTSPPRPALCSPARAPGPSSARSRRRA
ncbi:hypothetical protein IMZ48_44655 [Candidatus Bathyarchaeota archaeon]|nr:hypothetical protein [Candidatus Bathyarchaeota archaeon]